VAIYITHGSQSYISSIRNGVARSSFGYWTKSFVFEGKEYIMYLVFCYFHKRLDLHLEQNM